MTMSFITHERAPKKGLFGQRFKLTHYRSLLPNSDLTLNQKITL